jgi:hypothetical protein
MGMITQLRATLNGVVFMESDNRPQMLIFMEQLFKKKIFEGGDVA